MSLSDNYISSTLQKNLLDKVEDKFSESFKKKYVEQEIFKDNVQSKLINCMISEVDDNHITLDPTTLPVVNLPSSKEGLVVLNSIKGRTIRVDENGLEVSEPNHNTKLKSVGDSGKLTIVSRGKNLVKEYILNKQISSTTGNIYDSDRGFVTNYIPINPNYDYVVSGHSGEHRSFVAFYDENYNYIKRTSGTLHTAEIKLHKTTGFDSDEHHTTSTLPPTTKYLVFNHYNIADISIGDLASTVNIQIEVGLVPTDYEKYQESKIDIILDSPLRQLPNGVCDEIVGNKLIRRVGKTYINEQGSYDNYNSGAQDSDTTMVFFSTLMPEDRKATSPEGYWLSNMPTISGVSADKGLQGAWLHNVDKHREYSYVRLYRSNLSTQDTEGAKEYMKRYPVEVFYELIDPIETEISVPALRSFNTTNIYIEDELTPEVTYSYDVVITYKEEIARQGRLVKDNKDDIDNNIIPYLMDIEYQILMMS